MNEFPGVQVGHYISRTYGALPLKVYSENDADVFSFVKIEDRPGVSSVLSLSDWDAFIVVGFGYSLVRLVEQWGAYQPDFLKADFGGHLLRADFASDYENHCMDTTQAVRLLHRLREMTSKPIYLVPAPLPAEWAAKRDGAKFDAWRAIHEAGDEAHAVAAYERQLRRLPGRRIKPIKQPQATISGTIWTRSEYALGQPNDAADDSFFARGDFYHMNKSFGEIALREIMNVVQADFDVSEFPEKTGSL
ncbi:hypothetical protein V1639_07155 [Pseudarthrobacter sp. J75]|uniref:hypothetical protein n=1 Tax=Pseudarthrobacter sp. J75 TaxID=3116486 RepID=UPI002E811ADE|nr:hypothetical protein [Pseudarthrobacter sp. J75]MEE2528804.1 hypothetical protein [Pseudarthrobacter sp. J75]